jgi:hypothetical protein
MMFSLSGPILLMSIGTRNMVRNNNLVKEGMEFVILTTPIYLDRKEHVGLVL